MTELAYLTDSDAAYVRTFTARVVALPPGAVVLDRTFFYPAGGGQPCDRGRLALPDGRAAEVVDVVKSGTSVVHRLRGGSGGGLRAAVGDTVEGTVDWTRRHRHMRLHTGQHLLSARIFASTRRRTRKATLGGMRAMLELDGAIPPDAVGAWATEMATAASHPRPVTVRFVARAEWDRHPASERSGLVPLPPLVDPVRVIEIDGLDVCPCGGTHLRTTGELGNVSLGAPEPLGDGGSRIFFELTGDATPTPGA